MTPVFLPGESQGQGEPGGLPSMGSHRVRHDWSDLAAMDIPLLFIHISVDGNLGCYYFLAIANNAAMNVGVQMSVSVLDFKFVELGIQSLSHQITLFEKLPDCCPKWLYHSIPTSLSQATMASIVIHRTSIHSSYCSQKNSKKEIRSLYSSA